MSFKNLVRILEKANKILGQYIDFLIFFLSEIDLLETSELHSNPNYSLRNF